MAKKAKFIPVNTMADKDSTGISIEKVSFTDLDNLHKVISDEETQSHRHDSHSFFLLEKGKVSIEIDFQKYLIKAPSIVYLHPNQVHRTTVSESIIVSSCSMTNENLNQDYLTLLEDMVPAKPLLLSKETFSIISETVSLCIRFAERKNDKLYHSLLKDSCNALVALIISQYLAQSKLTDQQPRFEMVSKAFKKLLERNYTTAKRPAEHARELNISTSYLNECVKNATGFSVSYHLQQRVVLEAKRLLYHSDKSIKEIAAVLGFDDYAYFSRVFTKVAGMAPLAFRNKNLD